MVDAEIMLTWICGALSGALWGAALEREEQKSAQLYGCLMLYFYSLCALISLISLLFALK
jgi:hypothetical protein